jgi:succinoglycan biosynthesis transport protein ExoP
LRNRSLSAGLAPTAASGILDVMTGAVSLPAITWTDPLSGLAFLPAGNSSRPIYASDALRSETLDKLFQALRKTYEYVIVDLPAVAPFADVRAAAHLLDSVILVAECGRTNISVLERALKVSSGIHELILGVTLNKADTNLLKGFD